jgi:hypothetical protein
MAYRVAYDVLDDSLLPAHEVGLVFLGFAVVWLAIWFFVYRYVAIPPERKKGMRAGFVVGGIFVAVGITLVAGKTWPTFHHQQQCRDWARCGDYQTFEGVVTGFQSGKSKSPTHFRVGDVPFTYGGYEPTDGGFRGRFTAPDSQDLKLRDGMAVRIAHRDGRILRIEIADKANK